MKEEEKYKIEDFWPEADKKLTNYFRRKVYFRWIYFFSAILFTGTASWFALSYFSNKNNQNKTIVSNETHQFKSNDNKLNKELNAELKNPTSNIQHTNNRETANNINKSEKINNNDSKISIPKQQIGSKKNKLRIKKNNKDLQSTQSKNSKNNSNVTEDYAEIKELNSEFKSIKRNTIFDHNLAYIKPLTENTINGNGIYFIPEKINISNQFKPGKIYYSAFLYAGFYNMTKQITSSNPDYIKRRQDEEQNILTPNYGLGIKINYKSLSFGAGAEMVNYGERLQYSDSKYGYKYITKENWIPKTDTTLIISEYYVNGIGYDNSYTTIRTDSIKQITNDSIYTTIKSSEMQLSNGVNILRYVEFPLFVEYHYRYNKWKVGLNAAFIPALINYTKASYIDLNQQRLNEITNEDLKQWIFNLRTGIVISYNVTKDYAVFINPNYRTNLNGVFISNNTFNQKYNAIGANMGLLISF